MLSSLNAIDVNVMLRGDLSLGVDSLGMHNAAPQSDHYPFFAANDEVEVYRNFGMASEQSEVDEY